MPPLTAAQVKGTIEEEYGDHLPVYVDTPKGPKPVIEVTDEIDPLINDGSPFILLIPDLHG